VWVIRFRRRGRGCRGHCVCFKGKTRILWPAAGFFMGFLSRLDCELCFQRDREILTFDLDLVR
jgi:hypothetical protein